MDFLLGEIKEFPKSFDVEHASSKRLAIAHHVASVRDGKSVCAHGSTVRFLSVEPKPTRVSSKPNPADAILRVLLRASTRCGHGDGSQLAGSYGRREVVLVEAESSSLAFSLVKAQGGDTASEGAFGLRFDVVETEAAFRVDDDRGRSWQPRSRSNSPMLTLSVPLVSASSHRRTSSGMGIMLTGSAAEPAACAARSRRYRMR